MPTMNSPSPLIALALFGTAVTDAAYVFFNAASARHACGELERDLVSLSAFAVISYTENR